MIKTASPDVFAAASAKLLEEEKAVTRTLDEIAAKRRQLPAVKVENPKAFRFVGTDGKDKTLLDLFENRRQLVFYHFMLSNKDKEGCTGCSFLADNLPNLAHLNSRDTTFAAAAPASVDKVNAFKERMGWTFPFYSSQDTFTGAGVNLESLSWKPGNGEFGLISFVRDGEDVFHTYSTTSRGCEVLLSTYSLLDMTHLGRQEEGNKMGFLLHDQY